MTAQDGDRRPLRAAVVGVGAFGRHHARIYTELAEHGVELIGLVDHGGPAAQEVAARLDVPLVGTVEELPATPDLVSVAVSTTQHRAVAEPLLRRGIHCLVEKPITDRREDAEALLEAAAAGGAVLHVGHVERFNPAAAPLLDLPWPPTYVEMHRLAPYRARARDVGVVMDLMIHDLDLLQRLLGMEAEHVTALTRTDHDGAEDVCVARCTFPGGVVARVVASRVAEARGRHVRVFGRDAWLHVDLDGGHAAYAPVPDATAWETHVAALREAPVGLGEDVLAGGLTPAEQALDAQPIALGRAEPLRAELAAFVAAVAGQPSAGVTGAEGLRALTLAEAVLRAAASGAAPQGA